MTYEEYSSIRDSLGLKDGQVASATGIGRSTFTDWKSGRSCPKADKIIKIASYLEVEIDTILPEIQKTESINKQRALATEDVILLRYIHSLSPKKRELLDAYLKILLEDS